MKSRLKFGPLSVFLFLSIFFHGFLFLFLFWTEKQQESLNTSWSGGFGDGQELTYVDLDDFFTPTKSISESKITKKPTTKTATTPKQKKSWGLGSSSTPAGGTGSGLDAVGQASVDSSRVIALIRKKIREQQKYPQVARDNDWTGTTQVGFQIDVDGSLKFVQVLKGSGHAVLDGAAIKAVRNAVPLPYFPDPMALSLEYKIE